MNAALVGDDFRQALGQLHRKLDALLARLQRQQVAAVADHLRGRERLRRNLEVAGLQLRHVENAVHHRKQVIAGIVDQLGVFAAARAVEPHPLLVDQHVGEADDGVERRAQLVAHIGEELDLGGVGVVGLGAGALQRLLLVLALGDVAHHRDHLGLAGGRRRRWL